LRHTESIGSCKGSSSNNSTEQAAECESPTIYVPDAVRTQTAAAAATATAWGLAWGRHDKRRVSCLYCRR
jgi:hypothetical protein